MHNGYFYFFYSLGFLFNLVFGQQIIILKKNNFVLMNDIIDNINVKKWSKQINKLTSNPINIYIDSRGGDVLAGLQFINNINWHIKQGKIINCIVKSAYSMAFIILQNCSNRYVMLSSTLMQHQISLSGLKGPLNNLINYLEMINSISDELDNNVSKRLHMNLDNYKNKIKNDWWLTGLDAITYGVADEMVIVGCDIELYDARTKQDKLIFDMDLGSNFVKTGIIEDLCPL